jgi:cyclase
MEKPFTKRSRPDIEEIRYKTQNTDIHINQLSEKFYLLEAGFAMGSNVCLVVGDDGHLLIDSMLERAHKYLAPAIKQISDKSITHIINTHDHDDHCGGSAIFQKAGAKVIAHKTTLYSRTLKPDITFDDVYNFDFCQAAIQIKYVGGHHSISDSIIHLVDENIVVMGDLLPGSALFPSVTVAAGVNDFFRNLDYALSLSDGRTRYIPAEGPPVNEEYLRSYKAIWLELVHRIGDLHKAGYTSKEISSDEEVFRICKLFGSGLNWNQLDGVLRVLLIPTLVLNWEFSENKVPADTLNSYIGKYQFPGILLEIVMHENQLYAQAPKYGRRKIFPTPERVLSCFSYDALKLDFGKNDSIDNTKCVLTFMNTSIEGTKLQQELL